MKICLLNILLIYRGEFLMDSKWCILIVLNVVMTFRIWLIILVITGDWSCREEGVFCIWLFDNIFFLVEFEFSLNNRCIRNVFNYKLKIEEIMKNK